VKNDEKIEKESKKLKKREIDSERARERKKETDK
jgi:hypothetical protein